jgi:predicted aldo/keto reductase-like oxidoreductase
MQYRPLGTTGLRVSILGFGAMRLPENEDEAIAVIQRAFDLGVNVIDTAPYYCKNRSEAIVGKALRGYRDGVLLSTKNPVQQNRTAGASRRQLDESLRIMGVETIDLYHMWSLNKTMWETILLKPDGPLAAAHKAKEEGLIRHICFSWHDAVEHAIPLIESGEFECMTIQYNLLNQSQVPAIEAAHSHGLGVLVMGPVGGGLLAQSSQIISRLKPAQARSNASLALRFVWANPAVSSAMSGMSSIAQVEENVATANRAAFLSGDELAAIQAALKQLKVLGDRFCTGCGYCTPCPQKVNIPEIFKYRNYAIIYDLTDWARTNYQLLGSKGHWVPGLGADACTECGECEPKCPQHIPIVEQLKEVHALLGGKAAGSRSHSC